MQVGRGRYDAERDQYDQLTVRLMYRIGGDASSDLSAAYNVGQCPILSAPFIREKCTRDMFKGFLKRAFLSPPPGRGLREVKAHRCTRLKGASSLVQTRLCSTEFLRLFGSHNGSHHKRLKKQYRCRGFGNFSETYGNFSQIGRKNSKIR